MRIFVDTEFTDFPSLEDKCDLISIGIVDENDREFYAELTDFRPEVRSEFVIEHIIPLLGKVPAVRGTKAQVAKELCKWLEAYKGEMITVSSDYNMDLEFVYRLMAIFPEDAPVSIEYANVWTRIEPRKLNEFWKLKEADGWIPHHALWDAIGNKYAYEDR